MKWLNAKKAVPLISKRENNDVEKSAIVNNKAVVFHETSMLTFQNKYISKLK